MGRGTGLGLSTVYGIHQQSRGLIDVTSKLEQGTTFDVYLPRVDDPPSPSLPRVPEPGQGEGRILVVEDDQSVRKLTVELLQTSGYEVLSCAGAREALSIVERLEGRVDVVITDVVMPGMKGDELAELLAKRFPGIKVILTSGYLD